MFNFLFPFQETLADLSALKTNEQKLYLVGGVIRDAIRGWENKDVDILCNFDTRIIARKVAEIKNGAFFVLDEERNTSRVIVNDKTGKKVFDFARLQGGTLQNDLYARDFTINAMAIDFEAPDSLIDPLHGLDDLRTGVLRACSQESFITDPVRVIRAVRYSVSHNLKMDRTTLKLLRAAVLDLSKVSGERKRDEFFKILETRKPAIGLELLLRLGILDEIGFPKTPEIADTLHQVSSLNDLLLLIDGKFSSEANRDLFETSCNLHLGRYYPELSAYFNHRNASDRSNRQALLLATWLINLSVQNYTELAHRFLLSKDEIEKIVILAKHQNELRLFIQSKTEISQRQLYRFFLEVGENALDLCFLQLSKLLSKQRVETGQVEWLDMLVVCEKVIGCWVEHPEIVSPVVYLNGNDLMVNFDLTPGPLIGSLIEKLREEQASGEIQNRTQALAWIEEQLSSRSFENQWDEFDSTPE